MAYVFPQKVLFKHCDAAGIVFYPRYFEMINDCIETFFDEVAAWPFAAMHPGAGVPTARIATEFTAPCRLGDRLSLVLKIAKLGRSSLHYTLHADCEGEARFHVDAVLVCVGGKGRPQPWPNDVRQKLETFMKGNA